MKGFNLQRPLTVEQKEALTKAFPDDGTLLAHKLQGAIPAVSLVSQTALMTAVANDTDPDLNFAQQVFGLGRPPDVLLAISTSGNSRNVVAAAKVARAFGIKVISLTGAGGGKLAPLANVTIRVDARDVPDVQELHLPVYHWLCAELEAALFGEEERLPAPSPSATGQRQAEPKLPDPIGLVVFDFDGVFTDNRVYTAQDGTEMVTCDRSDSLGIDRLRRLNVPMLILSTEANPVVAARAAKLKLPVESACADKAEYLRSYLATRGIKPESVIYVGNDLNDIEAMRLVGFTSAPLDAHPEIRRLVSLPLQRPGGRGAVRELCDFIVGKVGS